MAGMALCAATSASCSGSEAALRKLKALRAWSSTYMQFMIYEFPFSVIHTFHEPGAILLKYAIEIPFVGLDVPFDTAPRVVVPPIAGNRPGTGHVQDSFAG